MHLIVKTISPWEPHNCPLSDFNFDEDYFQTGQKFSTPPPCHATRRAHTLPSPCTQALILKILPSGGSNQKKGESNDAQSCLLSPK